MHPSLAALVAFCDGEAGPVRTRRISGHLAKCKRCGNQLRRIRSEKGDLSAGAWMPAPDTRQSLAGVLSAIADWRRSPNSVRATELKSRLQLQIETYFGSPAVSVVERPGMPAEEFLGRANAMLEAFLGPAAAEAVRDDVLDELDSIRSEVRP